MSGGRQDLEAAAIASAGGTAQATQPELSCDALADELMEAIREHPAGLLSAEMFSLDGGVLQAAYNRLWDCVRGLPDPPAGRR